MLLTPTKSSLSNMENVCRYRKVNLHSSPSRYKWQECDIRDDDSVGDSGVNMLADLVRTESRELTYEKCF